MEGGGVASLKPKKTRTYWELVGRDFKRNGLAMFGSAIIFFVVFVAVFCSLIANQRPLYLEAKFPADYDNSMFIIDEQLYLLSEGDGTVTEDVKAAHDLLLSNVQEAANHIEGEWATTLTTFRDDFLKVSPVTGTFSADAIVALMDQFSPLYDAEITTVTRYPAFRALYWKEIWFMFAFVFGIVIFAIRKRFKRLVPALLLILIPATLLTMVRATIYPDINDTRAYRSIIEAPEFAENGGKVLRTIVPYGENENIIREARTAPTWWPWYDAPEENHYHLLGTDTNGRDVLARMVYGARVSMLIGIIAVSIYTFIGIVLGALAGYYGGWIDIALSRIIEIVICFPVLMLILAVQAFLAPDIKNIILAMAALWWTSVARLQRAEFLRLVNLDYVLAVRAVGGSNFRIIFMHILPNALGPILVLVSFGIAGSILVESGLSFLGFGVPQPTASWGDLLNNGRNDIKSVWWLTIFPGFAIFITVTCFNLIGEGVRDALDPRRDH